MGMKYINIIMIALLFAACEKMPSVSKTATEAPAVVISGGFECTKTAITDMSGTTAKVVWTLNDRIGILSKSNPNAMAVLAEQSAGQETGIFLPTDSSVGGSQEPVTFTYPETGNEDFFIYYPYEASVKYDSDNSIVTSSLQEIQFQDRLGDLSVGKYGFSYGTCNVNSEERKVNFNLTHRMAYVCLRANYADAPGYQLHSVQFIDSEKNWPLTGRFTYNPKDDELESIEGEESYSVKVEAVAHDFTSTPESQDLYMTLLPGDYSKTTFTVVVSFINDKGSTITVPMTSRKGWNFKAGTLSILNLGDIHRSDCTLDWYEVEEVRDLVGGWAYGEQNCYMIASLGSGKGNAELTIQVKARGDFAKVAEPVYYGFISHGADKNTRRFLEFEDGTNKQDSFDAARGQFTPAETHRLTSDYKFTVYSVDQSVGGGTFAVVGIYDKDKNLLWSFTFQRYRDYDPPKDVEYPAIGVKLMDRNLGCANGNDNLSGTLNSYAAYYQWGRKDPFMWLLSNHSQWSRIARPDGCDRAYVASHPYKMFTPPSETSFWMEDNNIDGLWGGKNTEGVPAEEYIGHKTVYDPCPEGYRVPDLKVIKHIASKAERHERYSTIAKYHTGADAAYSFNTGWGGSEFAYPLGDGSYDPWLYSGLYYNYSSKLITESDSGYGYWSNQIADEGTAYGMYGYYLTNWSEGMTLMSGAAMAVRCQKED